MLFQALDNKKECVGIYCNGELLFSDLQMSALTATWDYSQLLENQEQIEYAHLYCGKTLDEVCPEHLGTLWEDSKQKLRAFLRSFHEAKLSLDDNCFYDLVPDQFLMEYYECRNKITNYVLNNYERPDNYDFLANLTRVTNQIATNKLNIDKSSLRPLMYKLKVRNFMKKLDVVRPYVEYDIFGTKTGRLTTKKNTFPILTLDKEYRRILKPANDWFVELDFNAAELRTMLALSGLQQPQEDIHEWNIKNVFKENITRDEAKTRIFAWLYGSEKESKRLSTTDAKEILRQTYQREGIISKHWTGSHVRTRFGRTIPSDNHHALSYIIQSSCVDNVNRQLIKIHDRLVNNTTRVAFTLHDSIVLDVSNAERELIPELVKLFSNTDLGSFKVNVSAGKNFGNLKRLNL